MKLATDYLGLKLAHPIVASASPLSREFDGIRRLEDAGAAAVVMPSIYEEEIEAEDDAYLALVEQGSWTQPEAAEGYFPEMTAFRVGGLQARLETLRAGGGGLRHPDHRQPQRLDAARLDELCPRPRTGGRRGDRAQPLPRADRPARKRRRGRAALARTRCGR